ncbi:MAG TPA: peptidoglycan DD-metalloendopeptidase family protein [Polyangia bacterium]|nr:peptidoglycan DD-metalloendopeptidase family protein [Polyangia bacterium]
MPRIDQAGAGAGADATEAYQQVESMLLRQMLQSSGAFKPANVAGGQVRADMFVEALADAVAKGGGIGIARMLEDSLAQIPGAADENASLPAKVSPHAPATAASAPAPEKLSAPTKLSSPVAATGALPAVLDLGAPEHVTSGFGPRIHPIDGGSKYHTGIDLRAPEGSPILAAESGVVKNAGQRGGYGNAVEIDHGGGLTTLYGHASELLVTPGEKVKEGQAIARAGSTGHATGPHLHFEVRVDDRPVDPTRALNAYRDRVDDSIAVKPHGRGAP